MGYYTVTDGGPDDGKFDDFDDALSYALDVALTMAADKGIDEATVDTFINGSPGPRDNGSWEAGACPEKDSGAYWPHVEWRD
jgi:hypothetical protein